MSKGENKKRAGGILLLRKKSLEGTGTSRLNKRQKLIEAGEGLMASLLNSHGHGHGCPHHWVVAHA